MSQIKDWFLELIESGDYEYLERMGAPCWAINEARRHHFLCLYQNDDGEAPSERTLNKK